LFLFALLFNILIIFSSTYHPSNINTHLDFFYMAIDQLYNYHYYVIQQTAPALREIVFLPHRMVETKVEYINTEIKNLDKLLIYIKAHRETLNIDQLRALYEFTLSRCVRFPAELNDLTLIKDKYYGYYCVDKSWVEFNRDSYFFAEFHNSANTIIPSVVLVASAFLFSLSILGCYYGITT